MRRLLTAVFVVCLVTAGFAPAVGLAAADASTGTETHSDRAAVSAAGTAPAAASAAPNGSAANGSTADGTTLTVLAYNDVQTAAAENGSFPRLVTLVERRRAAHDNPTVVVGAGDQVSPHALSPVSQWRAPVDVLNQIEPDADVVGNHDLDYGFDAVPEFAGASNYPWLTANVVNESTGEPIEGTKAYHVVEKDGVRVAFVGLADGAIEPKTAVDFEEEGVEVRDYRTVGPETARMLKEEKDVDVVVALAHIGVPDAKKLAEADTGNYIDAIAVGDDEKYYPPNETAGSVIFEGVARAEYLAEVNLTVEDGDVTHWNGRLVSTEGVPKDEQASATIEEYRSAGLGEVVAYSETELDARFATNYHRESGYGNLVTDAMRARTGADVAITNAGGIRSNRVYGPGNITVGDVSNTLPFANTLVTVRLTGEELKETLASQVVTLESETGQQYGEEISQQVSGVTFEWVPHEDVPPSERIRDVHVNGERLDPDATYTVTVNSYMAGGGSSYPLADEPRVSTTPEVLANVVTDYMEEQGTVAPTVEGRMQRVDADVGDETVTVDGNGMVVLQYEAPDDAASINASSVRFVTPDGAVEPEQANVDGDRMTLVFSDSAVSEVVDEGGCYDVYATYESTEHELVYFESARLNGDVDVRVRHASAGSDDAAEEEPEEPVPTDVAVPLVAP